MEDIEIARNAKLEHINKIGKKIGLKDDALEPYGKYKAKIDISKLEKEHIDNYGKVILVTAMSPTPLGEGKTTISISIADSLSKMGEKTILTLREPSLGPVFGIKGGATGGGRVQVAPMEDINLHFTGDIHAITSANNLLSSMLDNHIYYGNELDIEEITWKRCVDLNDRQLRKINTGLSGEKKIVEREDGFDITVASEIMAIVCLAEDMMDLKERLGKIIIGYNKEKLPVYAKDLNAQGAMAVLLKEAIKPNLVQTLENTPAIIHGGPFANIAHGCNSVIATKTAMKLAKYVVTECGFGADLGAEKFMNIKCRKSGIKPSVVVIVATAKALKYHGGVDKSQILEQNIQAIDKGIENLYKHIENIKEKFGANVIVALNRFNTDVESEIEHIKHLVEKRNVEFSIVEGYEKGSQGGLDIGEKIKQLAEKNTEIAHTYDLEDPIETKIKKVATNIYGANEVLYLDGVNDKIKRIEELGYKNLPVCIAKTQYSFSDNPKVLDVLASYSITVTDVLLKAGAGFILVLTGNVMTMPGLPKNPAAENIDIETCGKIIGIF